jgi:hypothetical protein
MSVNTVLEAFQAVHRAVGGVKRAPDPKALPRSLNDDDLPFVLCIPGPAEWNEQAVGYPRQNREIIVRVFVKPVMQGEDIGPALQVVTRLMQAFGAAYLADVTLGDEIDHLVQPFSDGGLEALEYAGNLYHGFEFRVEATEKG